MRTWPFTGRDPELRAGVEALTRREARGLVISGPPQVGRTRMLEEIAAALRRQRPTVIVRGSRSGRTVPFGALAGQAPLDPARPGTWGTVLRQHLPERAILAVDDGHLLDDASALLLLRLASEGPIPVVVTVSDGGTPPHAITAMWKEQLVPRIELAPLDRLASDRLVSAALGGPVATPALHTLWDLSRGLPLLLHELVLSGLATGRLVEHEGLWVGLGTPPPTSRLRAIHRDLLEQLPRRQREALELVAVGEPVRHDIACALLDQQALAALEQQGLVGCDGEDRWALMAPAQALAIRADLGVARCRALAGRLSEVAPPPAALAGQELAQVASWHLDAGRSLPPEDLVRAAQAASQMQRDELAERLARAALPAAPVEARLVLAGALARRDRAADAGDLLGVAVAAAGDDAARAAAVTAQARLLYFRAARRDEALMALEDVLGQLTDPACRDRIRAELGFLVALTGDLPRAIDLCQRALDSRDADAAARLSAAEAASVAMAWSGRLHEARRTIQLGQRLAAEQGEPPYLLALTQQLVELYAGASARAIELAQQGYEFALGAETTGLAAVWATQLGAALLFTGGLERALQHAAEGARLAEIDDELGILPLATGLAAQAAASRGELSSARGWLARHHRARRLDDPRTRIMTDRATVAMRAAEGDLEDAAHLARRAGLHAADHHHRVWGAMLLHDVVRYGYADRVVAELEEVGGSVDGELAALFVAHAHAAAERSPDDLARVGEGFASLGYLLWGAEAFARAAQELARRGRTARANLHRARATVLLERCEGARTPAIQGIGGQPLTRREREVALLAGGGLTSREIADRLVVSVRTVDNHLSSVYRKLGISSRHELTEAMNLRA